MPDTGAPWNIPYVDPTDLVRDYPQASEDLADAIADGLTAAVSPGIGSNVVQTVKTDVFSASLAQGDETSTNVFEATITPSSNTSKVLVVVHAVARSAGAVATGDAGANITIYRATNAIALGDAAGSRSRRTASGAGSFARTAGSTIGMTFLDSPATDSPVTYGVRLSHNVNGTRTVTLNQTSDDTDNSSFGRFISTITLIEVAA
jgi:hypothetical protein